MEKMTGMLVLVAILNVNLMLGILEHECFKIICEHEVLLF